MSPLSNNLSVDLHGFRLLEAELEACEALIEAQTLGLNGVEFIHGYRHGHAILDYIRERGGLRKDLRTKYPELPRVKIMAKKMGLTTIQFIAKEEC